MRIVMAVAVAVLVVASANASTQSVAESVVSKQSTLMIDAIDGRYIGSLARAANVPMGIYLLPPLPQNCRLGRPAALCARFST